MCKGQVSYALLSPPPSPDTWCCFVTPTHPRITTNNNNQDMQNVENKAVGAPLHKFIAAFRFGLKASLNRWVSG